MNSCFNSDSETLTQKFLSFHFELKVRNQCGYCPKIKTDITVNKPTTDILTSDKMPFPISKSKLLGEFRETTL